MEKKLIVRLTEKEIDGLCILIETLRDNRPTSEIGEYFRDAACGAEEALIHAGMIAYKKFSKIES